MKRLLPYLYESAFLFAKNATLIEEKNWESNFTVLRPWIHVYGLVKLVMNRPWFVIAVGQFLFRLIRDYESASECGEGSR